MSGIQNLTLRTFDVDFIDPGEVLVRLSGFDLSVSIDESRRSQRLCRVKVYDPEARQDFDGDVRAWRFGFVVSNVEVNASVLYVVGWSKTIDHLDSIDGYLCREKHLPWEHDGMCYTTPTVGYEGWVEMSVAPSSWIAKGKVMTVEPERSFEFFGALSELDTREAEKVL